MPRPLAVIVQSTSAAGKSALMDAVLAFVPAEDRVRFSAMTGQSLFYMASRTWRTRCWRWRSLNSLPGTPQWWDITTPGQWPQHLIDYSGFGNGTPLFTR
jgi:hypothetical protein